MTLATPGPANGRVGVRVSFDQMTCFGAEVD
jgi:hypothetical protein